MVFLLDVLDRSHRRGTPIEKRCDLEHRPLGHAAFDTTLAIAYRPDIESRLPTRRTRTSRLESKCCRHTFRKMCWIPSPQ